MEEIKEKIKKFFESVPPYISKYKEKNIREVYGESHYPYIYAVVGGTAVSHYTKGKRKISDLDLLLMEDYPVVFEKIVKEKTKNLGFTISAGKNEELKETLQLHLFTSSDKFYGALPEDLLKECIANVDFEGINVPMACPELIVASKIDSKRSKDIEDIKMLKKLQKFDEEKLKKILAVIS